MNPSRLLLFLALVSLSATALAKPQRLVDYNAFWRALKAGEQVRVVVEYAKCTLTLDGKVVPAPDATGGTVFESWEQFAKGVVRNEKAYVASSHTVLIAHPRYGHVLNYVRFRIYEDGAVEITARYLKPDTFEIVMDETFTGGISNGKDEKGVHLFVD